MAYFIQTGMCIVGNKRCTPVTINVDYIIMMKSSDHKVISMCDADEAASKRDFATDIYLHDGSPDAICITDLETPYNHLGPDVTRDLTAYGGSDVIDGEAFPYSVIEIPTKGIKDILNLPGGRVPE